MRFCRDPGRCKNYPFLLAKIKYSPRDLIVKGLRPLLVSPVLAYWNRYWEYKGEASSIYGLTFNLTFIIIMNEDNKNYLSEVMN